MKCSIAFTSYLKSSSLESFVFPCSISGEFLSSVKLYFFFPDIFLSLPLCHSLSFFFFALGQEVEGVDLIWISPSVRRWSFHRGQVANFFLILFFSNCVNKRVLNAFFALLPHSCKRASGSFEANYWVLREISIISLFTGTALFS